MIKLSCAWRDLILVNYPIDPGVLEPYIPDHTELDLYKGECLMSIAGFIFQDVRVLGLPIPFHQNFEEFNLRFYVKHKHRGEIRRGVVFLREFVPNSGISIMANIFAREKYRKFPMRHSRQSKGNIYSASYGFKVKDNWNTLDATAREEEVDIAPGSLEDFIAEHYFGYNRWYGKRTLEIRLQRPRWKYRPLLSFEVQCKFEDFYPPAFVPYLYGQAHSAQFIPGSRVLMMPSRIF